MKKSMTWGVLPPSDEFEDAFDALCGGGLFTVIHGMDGHAVKAGAYNCPGLRGEIERLVAMEQEGCWQGPEDKGPGAWASSVMTELGFEWI